MNLADFARITRDLALRAMRHPVAFLALVNAACAILGLAQFAVALALLAPPDFAVIGVLAATGSLVANLVDLRLPDLATRLYLGLAKSELEERRAILSAGLRIHATLALLIMVLTAAAMTWLTPRLLENRVAPTWIVCMTLVVGAQYITALLGIYLRLLGQFTASGWLRLATTGTGVALMLAVLMRYPDLDGYFKAQAFATAIALAATLVVTERHTRALFGASLLAAPTRQALTSYNGARGFLAAGSLLGFAKILTRNADMLLVAALTSDQVAGSYRVARQASDSLFGLSDAVHQFYHPTIVAALARNDQAAFRAARLLLVVIGTLASLAAVGGALMVLDPLVAALLPRHRPAVTSFAVLAGLLAVTIGIHGWLWPVLVAHGRIGLFGCLSLAGGIIQLAAILLLSRFGWLDPTTAAATAWLAVVVTYFWFLIERVGRRLQAAAS